MLRIRLDRSSLRLYLRLHVKTLSPGRKSPSPCGDPEQLPPTVISKNSANEGAKNLKRSLMERLFEAGYPSTTLTTNYRSHPDILRFFNSEIYDGQLTPVPSSSARNRVGYVWDDFTCNRHYLYNANLEGGRRLFISVSGIAVHRENSPSWANREQANAALAVIQELYGYRTISGERIVSRDIMFLSPYKDQVRLVRGLAKPVMRASSTSRTSLSPPPKDKKLPS